MTEQIKSIKLDGNNNVIIQSVQNSEIKIETIDWDSFVQKYTIEQRERVQELQKLLSRSEELFGLKEQKYARQIGELQQDIQQKETQLKDIIQQYKDKDLRATTSLYQRAFAYFIAGELNKALEVLDDAQLDAAEQQQAEARILKANILQLENRFDEAEKQLKRAVAIYPSWENTFAIAHFYQFLNVFSEAERCYYECLEKTSTDNERATTLNSLANLQRDKNEFNKAEQTFMEALVIMRQLIEINPLRYISEIGVTLNNLAVLYQRKNEIDKAQQVHERALEIRRQLAQDNPKIYLSHVSETLNNLGILHYAKNNFKKAEEIYKEAIEIRRQLEKDNPKTYLSRIAETLNNLGLLYYKKNELHKAEKVYKEALKVRQQLAQDNPKTFLTDVALTLNNLGALYHKKNELEKAKQIYEKALDMRRQLAEVNPQAFLPYVADTLNNLGTLYDDRGEYKKTQQSYIEALSIYRRLVENNPQTFSPYLAVLLINLSAFHSKSVIDKEKSYTLIDEAITVLIPFEHIGYVQNYLKDAYEILEVLDVDVEAYIKQKKENL